jgi:hypothetical protein
LSARRRVARSLPLVTSLALALVCPASGLAQTGERLSLGVTAAHARLRMVGFDEGNGTLSGLLYGVEGRASWWRFHARGEFRQGRLEREGPRGSSRVISARAGLGVRPVEWVALTAGPRVTSVDIEGEDELIVRWQVELHASAPLVAGLASAFASVGGPVAGTEMDWDDPWRSLGGDVGLLLGGVDSSIWGRLGYRVDREALLAGPWQSAELVYVSVGVSVPASRNARE